VSFVGRGGTASARVRTAHGARAQAVGGRCSGAMTVEAEGGVRAARQHSSVDSHARTTATVSGRRHAASGRRRAQTVCSGVRYLVPAPDLPDWTAKTCCSSVWGSILVPGCYSCLAITAEKSIRYGVWGWQWLYLHARRWKLPPPLFLPSLSHCSVRRRWSRGCWNRPSALLPINRRLFCRSTVGSITCNREHDRANCKLTHALLDQPEHKSLTGTLNSLAPAQGGR
jgi:hypothetical protein